VSNNITRNVSLFLQRRKRRKRKKRRKRIRRRKRRRSSRRRRRRSKKEWTGNVEADINDPLLCISTYMQVVMNVS